MHTSKKFNKPQAIQTESTTQRHVKIKSPKTREKEKFLKGTEKRHTMPKETEMRTIIDYSLKAMSEDNGTVSLK